MAKLSDRKKKEMIADYVECENYSAVARKYKVSRTTVKNIVTSDKSTAERLEAQKEENTKNVLQHMESKTGVVCEILDNLLCTLSDKEKLGNASVREIATALGIVIDKFAKSGGAEDKNGALEKLIRGLKDG